MGNIELTEKEIKMLKIGIKSGIEVKEETIKEIKEALQNNVDWPSEKKKYEVALATTKEKNGWFANLIKRHIQNKLTKGTTKPPKRLNKNTREHLEEYLKKCEEELIDLQKLKLSKNN